LWNRVKPYIVLIGACPDHLLQITILDAAHRNNASPVELYEVHNRILFNRAEPLLTRAEAGFGQSLDVYSDCHSLALASG
jgi:hypothetical protein